MSLASGTGLAAGAGGSGLSESQAKNLIKANTPWQTIEKISVGTASEVVFDEIPDTWSTLLVNFDNISGSNGGWQLQMQVYVGGASSSSGTYSWNTNSRQISGAYPSGSTGSGEYTLMTGYSADANWTATGDMIVSGLTATQYPIFRSRIASGTSSANANMFDMSGSHTSTSQLTALRFYLNTGNFDSGTIHLSGLN